MIKNQIYEIPRSLQEQHDSMVNLKTFIKEVIQASGKKCTPEEVNKVCQNDAATIDNLLKRVRQQGSDANNPSNQNVPSPINQIKLDSYQQLYNQIGKNIDSLTEQIQAQDKPGIQYHKAQLNYQLESVNQNSIRIDIDLEVFREKIQIINGERDQIIEIMQDIIRKFEEINSQNISQDIEDDESQDSQYQNLKNIMERAIIAIVEVEENLQNCVELVKRFYNNNSNQGSNIVVIQDLQNRLNGNLSFFTYFKKVFSQTIEAVQQFQIFNRNQSQKIRDLQRKFHELQRTNNQYLNQFKVQMMESQKNKKKIDNLMTGICLNANRKTSQELLNHYEEFNDQIIIGIKKLSQIIYAVFPIQNLQQKIQLDRDTITDMISFINNISQENENINTDSQEQQWERSLNLFQKIISKISTDSLVNQYIKNSFEWILDIKRKVQENKEQIQRIKERANNQAPI
ncbi:unnamed protein product (macronuclear) [Paramecium tetraurelia]|uniref:Uncharacterized protein n=1 Tax=Paramecium tetraurelia TaxID=5888 RepID=A0CBK0_PARTE|nr:uncharacterized protein GSPATT00036950001 [Paramecium tetraurelia]CAK68167.1 unnamed protein product [Paramecium tetraurelia]|eukprot:XP_001435564.1 hypothetical protein (macronuclear) [Paramecium tetraurelia strain d4-2]